MNSRESGKRLIDLYRALSDEETFTVMESALLLRFLRYMNNDTFESFPGQQLLMRKLKVTKKPLIKALNSLLEKGAIAIVKKHGASGCTVYKIVWAERKIAEMGVEAVPPAKKASNRQPFSHHDNLREDSAAAQTVLENGLYNGTQDQSSYDDQWYEEVAFDIKEEAGASSPASPPSNGEELPRIWNNFDEWWEARLKSSVPLSERGFKRQALYYGVQEEEIPTLYVNYINSRSQRKRG